MSRPTVCLVWSVIVESNTDDPQLRQHLQNRLLTPGSQTLYHATLCFEQQRVRQNLACPCKFLTAHFHIIAKAREPIAGQEFFSTLFDMYVRAAGVRSLENWEEYMTTIEATVIDLMNIQQVNEPNEETSNHPSQISNYSFPSMSQPRDLFIRAVVNNHTAEEAYQYIERENIVLAADGFITWRPYLQNLYNRGPDAMEEILIANGVQPNILNQSVPGPLPIEESPPTSQISVLPSISTPSPTRESTSTSQISLLESIPTHSSTMENLLTSQIPLQQQLPATQPTIENPLVSHVPLHQQVPEPSPTEENTLTPQFSLRRTTPTPSPSMENLLASQIPLQQQFPTTQPTVERPLISQVTMSRFSTNPTRSVESRDIEMTADDNQETQENTTTSENAQETTRERSATPENNQRTRERTPPSTTSSNMDCPQTPSQ